MERRLKNVGYGHACCFAFYRKCKTEETANFLPARRQLQILMMLQPGVFTLSHAFVLLIFW